MKRLPVIVLVAAAAVGIVWLLSHQSVTDEDLDELPATQVAVRVGKIVRTTLRAHVTAYGIVEPAPAGERPAASAKVAPSVAGVVVAVNAVEGQRVPMGGLLVQMDSRAVDVTAAFAEKNLERQKGLIQIEGTSQKNLQEAEQQLDAARVQQALLRVESPLAGTVTRVNVKPGEAVDLTTVLAEVVDLDRLVVSARVPSGELASLAVGQAVAVISPRAPASPIAGSLNFIGPDVDVQTGTAIVRAELPAGSGLRPGEAVTIRIVSAEHEGRLAVPASSVVKNADGESVIAVVESDTAVQRRVVVGLRDDGWVEVEGDGLRPDMTVVTEGAYALPEETKVRVMGD